MTQAVIVATLVCALSLLMRRLQCSLIREPTDVYTVKGSTVVLPCSTDLGVPVQWLYERAGGDVEWITIDQVLNENPRFQISTEPTGSQYNLTITDVELEDAGTFRCVDDEGFGYDFFLDGIPNNMATAELRVIDNKLKCRSMNNVTNLQEESFLPGDSDCSIITLKCRIKFRGNVSPPLLKWTLLNTVSNNSERPIHVQRYASQTVKILEQYSKVESRITLSASEILNQSSLQCRVYGFGEAGSEIFWSSEIFNIQVAGFNESHVDCRFSTVTIQLNGYAVNGLTVVDDEIFVVREGQRNVNVYDSQTLNTSRDIHVSDMRIPVSMDGCAYNRALYISDPERRSIYRVDLANNSITRWNMKKFREPRGLAMSAEHTLLITVQMSGDYAHESRIVEFTNEGQEVREIRLDKSITWAWQTVQLYSNQFIVAHGRSFLNRVCVVNADGQIKMCYGGEMGGDDGQLNAPLSITIDRKNKRIFLADSFNDRILTLDTELTFLGEVQTPRDLKTPHSVYFDSSTDRLFVGEPFSGGRLLVLSPTNQ